jgi:hypothetical protein
VLRLMRGSPGCTSGIDAGYRAFEITLRVISQQILRERLGRMVRLKLSNAYGPATVIHLYGMRAVTRANHHSF